MERSLPSKWLRSWNGQRRTGFRVALKTEYPNDERMRADPTRPFTVAYSSKRVECWKKELMGHLRTKRRMRRSRQHSRIFKESAPWVKSADAISIRGKDLLKLRTALVPGHWEGDLLSGSRNSHIVTLVERHSRFAMLIKVPSKDTAVVVVTALSRHIRKLPRYPAALVDVGSRTGDGETARTLR